MLFISNGDERRTPPRICKYHDDYDDEGHAYRDRKLGLYLLNLLLGEELNLICS